MKKRFTIILVVFMLILTFFVGCKNYDTINNTTSFIIDTNTSIQQYDMTIKENTTYNPDSTTATPLEGLDIINDTDNKWGSIHPVN